MQVELKKYSYLIIYCINIKNHIKHISLEEFLKGNQVEILLIDTRFIKTVKMNRNYIF